MKKEINVSTWFNQLPANDKSSPPAGHPESFVCIEARVESRAKIFYIK